MTATDKARAVHAYIDASGTDVGNKIEQATGISYKPASETNVFRFQIPGAVAGEPGTMLGAFGAKTLATNTVSAQYGAEEKGVRPRKDDAFATDYEALIDRFEKLEPGVWGAERGGGGIGINLDKLAEAAALAKMAQGKDFDQAAFLARLKGEEGLASKVRKVPEIAVEYARLTAKGGGVSLDDI